MSIRLVIAAAGCDIALLVRATRAGSNDVYSALMPWVFMAAFAMLISEAYIVFHRSTARITGARGIGMRYFLTLMSIELWPLGWALGNIVTKQMLGAVASTGGAWLQLESTVFVVVGLWIIINAVFWPALISKALISGGTHAGHWIFGAVSPVLSAGQGAVNVATTAASGGGPAAVQAGGLSPASRPTKSPKALRRYVHSGQYTKECKS